MITNEYGVAERQRTLLEMMKDFDQFMTEHELEYSLCGGTLLGAIRHQGFIPWDDDVDVIMDRENFDKLVATFERLGNRVEIQRDEKEAPTQYAFKRMLWVYRFTFPTWDDPESEPPMIDVFTMDASPNSWLVRKAKTVTIKALQGMMRARPNLSDYSFFYRICLVVTFIAGKALSDACKFKLYDAVSRIGNGKPTLKITAYNAIYKFLDLRYDCAILDKLERRPFEDAMLPTMWGYHSYLTTQYGDYMTPPPVEERVAQHM